VDRRGGPGPSVHHGPIKGGKSPFNLGRPRRSDGPGRVWARPAGNGRCVAAPADGAVAARRRRAKDGLPTTKLDGDCTKTKRRAQGTHQRGLKRRERRRRRRSRRRSCGGAPTVAELRLGRGRRRGEGCGRCRG
jgi:hypothetical protein